MEEIKQRTVVGFTFQELLPRADNHHPRDREILGFGDFNLLITYSSPPVSVLWVQTDIPHPDVDQDTGTDRVGEKGILTTDGPDFSGPTMGLSYFKEEGPYERRRLLCAAPVDKGAISATFTGDWYLGKRREPGQAGRMVEKDNSSINGPTKNAPGDNTQRSV